jgi:predicted  nucleic acid-binding Zn-ribbon protein
MASNDEIKSLERIVEKLDLSIDKLTEVSNNVSKLLAVHDTRLNIIEKDTVRNEDDIRDIHVKIDNLAKEINSKLDQSMANSVEGHAKIQAAIEEKLQGIDARVKVLEVWRWLVIGGALAIGYLVNKLYK